MTFTWNHWLKRVLKAPAEGRRTKPRRPSRCQPGVEALEARLVPAFNLTIGTGVTASVTHNAAAGTFVANATGANIAVADIRADLLAGKSVTVSDGATGTETGNITWLANSDLDYNGVGLGGLSLTVVMDPSSTNGTFLVGSRILDSNTTTLDALNVNLSATGNLTVNSSILAGTGSITLSADTKADGTGDDGVGTLAIGPGATVSGAAVTLRGADVNIDTSANPGTVSALRQVIPNLATVGTQPATLAFDAAGNLFVANSFGNTVSKITPQGQVSTFASGFNRPFALAFDAQGNLFVGNLGSNSISKVAPEGTVSTFVTGVAAPYGLAFDAAGNLFVADDLVGTAGGISKVTPQGQVSTFVTGFNRPAGLAFDAQGNLYADVQGSGTVIKVTPDGKTVTTFATGLDNPYALAFDPQGNLYVTSVAPGAVIKITPQGQQSTFASGFSGPDGLAFDAAGNLFVANFNTATVGKIDLGTVTVRSSLPTRPIAIGGADNAVAGVNLTDAQLARVNAADAITFGDANQTGDVSLVSVTTTAPLVQVIQNPAGPGTVFLNEADGPGLVTTNGNARFTSGTGGLRELNFGFNTLGIDAGTGGLSFNGGGDVGTLVRPLFVKAARLNTGNLAGTLFLRDQSNLATGGPAGARSIFLTLGGDFTTRAGDLNAGSTELFFNGANLTQHLDSGGQAFGNVVINGVSFGTIPYLLQLVNNPLSVLGNLIDNSSFDANGQAVTVAGLTTDAGSYLAGTAPQNFLGGLTLTGGTFQGGSGPVTVGGLTLDTASTFVAPATTLTDTGDFTNQGGVFDPDGGTVVFAGMNQHINGSSVFHNLTKAVTVTDTLTVQAHSTQTVTGLLALQGAPGQPLLLRSSIPGQPWAFAPQAGLALNNLDVQDGLDPLFVPGGVVDTVLTVAAPADVAVQADVALGNAGVQFAGVVARYSGPGDTNMYWGTLVGVNGQFQADIFRAVNNVWTLLASVPVAAGTGTLRFEVLGSSLKLFLNNALATFATDTALTAGRVGVRTSAGAGVTNFSSGPIALSFTTLPFADNFDAPANGAQLSRFWTDRLGDETVQNHQIVSAVTNPTSADPNQQLALSTVNGVSAAAVSVQADVTVGKTGVQFAGLVARYSGPGDTNLYWGAIVGVNGKFQAELFRNVGGVWTLLASNPVSTGTATLRLDVLGSSLKLYVNGTLATFASDLMLTAPGTVGLRNGGGVTTDNFTAGAITLLPQSLPFSDNFNAQADGSQLSLDWQDRLGDEVVKNHQIVSQVNNPNSGDVTQSLALATVAGLNVADVTVQADVGVAATGLSYGGVVARYSGTGDQNMYWAGVIGNNGSYQVVLFVNVNGTWTQLASKAATTGTGTLKFGLKGSALTVTFGTVTLTATDTQLTSGTVGVRGAAGVTYDNFSAA